jgi:hypothetical protein
MTSKSLLSRLTADQSADRSQVHEIRLFLVSSVPTVC